MDDTGSCGALTGPGAVRAGAGIPRHLLLPGAILHVRHERGWICRAIRRCCGSWGDHDGLLVQPGMAGRTVRAGGWAVGDSVPMRARLTPLRRYDARLGAGEVALRLYAPERYTLAAGQGAARYWVDRVRGSRYDLLSYLRLAIKTTCMDFEDSRFAFLRWLGRGSLVRAEWARWCTEGCAEAWRCGAGRDVWGKRWPTPGTTEHRATDGALTLLWESPPAAPSAV